MSVPVVWVAPDLSEMRLHGASGADTWHAPEFRLEGEEAAPDATAWRQRATEAAVWLTRQRGVKRRLGAVVVDTAESICLWVRSSSLASPVLAASVSRLTEEWGDQSAMWTVEPVYDAPSAPESGGDHALSAVCHHDALIRLLLDALDKRGVVPGGVLSGWHALGYEAAHPAGADGGVTCVIAHEPSRRRLEWAWVDASGLVAGGTAAVGELDGEAASAVADAAMQRARMDWMTWSSQLGMSMDRAVVVGPGAEALADAWRGAMPERRVRVERTDDAVSHVLEAVSRGLDGQGASAASSSTRTCLGRITRRPTRRTRQKYLLAAGSALVAAAAIGSVAVWMRAKAEGWRERSEEARAEVIDVLNTTWPGGIEGRPQSYVREARRLYEQDVRESGNVDLPPHPFPIYEETRRVARVLVEVAEATREDAPEELAEDWQIRIMKISVDDASLRLSLMVPQRQVGTAVGIRLNENEALALWQPQSGAAPSRPIFQGSWKR